MIENIKVYIDSSRNGFFDNNRIHSRIKYYIYHINNIILSIKPIKCLITKNVSRSHCQQCSYDNLKNATITFPINPINPQNIRYEIYRTPGIHLYPYNILTISEISIKKLFYVNSIITSTNYTKPTRHPIYTHATSTFLRKFKRHPVYTHPCSFNFNVLTAFYQKSTG